MLVSTEVSALCLGELHNRLAGEMSVMLSVYCFQSSFSSVRMKVSGEMLNSIISIK